MEHGDTIFRSRSNDSSVLDIAERRAFRQLAVCEHARADQFQALAQFGRAGVELTMIGRRSDGHKTFVRRRSK